ncbi:hypothetical protein CHELA1G11_60021 [Hyphomicrobiales bacterium]|nr:hypothetical protein CHELA41_10029 [Hyphomicrobiales bacterium]CAH1657135.1 hypothetical protein CHELA17_30019 [Chelatococcus asaccharovorans]CAH1661039.1 hypothetical protein CHELA20_20023 [Hyphomicrobiales bacterium]CAH1693310.1 hypothetical protein BOSEA31B_30023 [Hyphomicrobiales bacterium]CAH1696698.1 hypothetical protein CHELA1G2_50020 [Hyphomicrobiales bacterium]
MPVGVIVNSELAGVGLCQSLGPAADRGREATVPVPHCELRMLTVSMLSFTARGLILPS